ncbi:MAG: sugar phosphate isomerase/epimerase [Methanomassiliicoccaceae archaeon]|jgi:sugar phosphate isomerase/epimerase|nr:sugar phosphate isomerase/epimerase [Methanomassiliicoccaceae archaeon]
MIGVSSTMFSTGSIEDVLVKISKEFGHWEILSEGEHYLPLVMKRLRTVAPSYDVKFSIHAPISDVNLAALSERMREAATMEIIATMEHAIELNASTVTFHPGMFSFVVPGQEQRSLEKAKRSIRTIDRLMREFKITACVENMPSFKFFIGRTAKEMLELVDGTDMRICFDIGHANTMDQIDEMTDLLGDRIKNVHIHDNKGDNDDHMTIGDGNIDFTKALKKLSKYKGKYIIEARSLESAVVSRDILSGMLSP